MTVGAWTLLSRIMGFARDIFIARMLGAGPVAEAFWVAFALPNMFRRFFAEGAFNMAFVPLYAKKLEADDDADAFARDAFSGLFVVLLIFSALGMIGMPVLVWAMASGFAGDMRFELAVFYGRIAFPYILLISLAALISGLLNANRRYLAAAAAPVFLNVVFILALALVVVLDWDTAPDIGQTLAWSVPLGGIAQLGLVYAAAWRAGHKLTLRRPRLTPDLKHLAVIAAPAALAGGVVQINLLVGRQVASFTEGAIVWLSMADRLYQLPLGVVGIAIGIVLLPELSRQLRANDPQGAQQSFSRATELALLFTLPSAVALTVAATPIIRVLFEGQAFTAFDTAQTALALQIYALGLPAFVLQKTLQPLYFAREDTKTPLRYALVSLLVNACVAIGLSYAIGYVAAAWGTTLAAWVMVVLLLRGRRTMGPSAKLDSRFHARLIRICAASFLMGLGVWAVQTLLAPFFMMPGISVLVLLGLVLSGMGMFALTGQILGAYQLSELRAALRRSSPVAHEGL